MSFYSFDFWNTLCVFNPEYTAKRGQVIANSKFNVKNLNTEEVIALISKISKIHTHITNFKEMGYNSLDLSAIVAICLKDPSWLTYSEKQLRLDWYDPDISSQREGKEIDTIFQDLALTYLPSAVPGAIETTNNVEKWCVASNTCFISSKTQLRILQKLGFSTPKFSVTSDCLSFAKPSSLFYDEIVYNFDCDRNDLIHIGDDNHADGSCQDFGISYYHVNPIEGYNLTSINKKHTGLLELAW